MQIKEMSKNQFEAKIRLKKGKAANQNLRKQGNIPAVLYGMRGNVLLEMAEEETRHLLEKMTGMHELISIAVSVSIILFEIKTPPKAEIGSH